VVVNVHRRIGQERYRAFVPQKAIGPREPDHLAGVVDRVGGA
jgi:hypothetical protein